MTQGSVPRLTLILFGLLACLSCEQSPTEPGDTSGQWETGWSWLHPKPSGEDLIAFWGEGLEPELRWVQPGGGQRWVGGAWLDDPLMPALPPDCIQSPEDMWLRHPESPVVWHFDGQALAEHFLTPGRGGPASISGVRAVWGFGADRAFAVVDYDVGEFDGETWEWTRVARISDLWGAAPDDMFGVYGPYIYHFDGVGWSVSHTVEGMSFSQLIGYGADELYALDPEGGVVYFDGAQWESLPALPVQEGGPYDELWANGPGSILIQSWRGDLWHWDGMVWNRLDDPDEFTPRLNGLWGDRNGTFRICGDSGMDLSFDGEALLGYPEIGIPPDDFISWRLPTLVDVAAESSSDLYVLCGSVAYGAGDRIFNYDGQSWTEEELGVFGVSLYDLEYFDGILYTVGSGGAFLMKEFETWEVVPTGAFINFKCIWAADSDSLYIGADGGVVLRRTGEEWDYLSIPEVSSVQEIHGVDMTEVYVIASYQEIHRFDGNSWVFEHELGGSEYPRKFWSRNDQLHLATSEGIYRREEGSWVLISALPASIDCWTTTADGSLLGLDSQGGGAHTFNGEAWTQEPSIRSHGLTAATATVDGFIFGVGSQGTVIVSAP